MDFGTFGSNNYLEIKLRDLSSSAENSRKCTVATPAGSRGAECVITGVTLPSSLLVSAHCIHSPLNAFLQPFLSLERVRVTQPDVRAHTPPHTPLMQHRLAYLILEHGPITMGALLHL